MKVLHREEPPQNPNKSAKKCSFFMVIFTWLEPGTAIALHVNVRTGGTT